MVGRNSGIDDARRRNKLAELPPEDAISDTEDAEGEIAERLDGSHYRDDILRLLFICCHPQLPATQQIALALRIVSGLTVKQIARAFLVSEAAMEQRITRAKAAVTKADVPFETPGAVERSERLAVVAAMLYLVFNEGYSASGESISERVPLCDEAIRLARLLLRLFPAEPEIMGLLSLLLLQHARAGARYDADGGIVLLDDQDRARWNTPMIAEGMALIDKAMRHQSVRAVSGTGGDRGAAFRCGASGRDRLDPDRTAVPHAGDAAAVAGGDAQSRGGGVESAGAAGRARSHRAPGQAARRLFQFYGVRGALLLQLGRATEARCAFDQAIALAGTTAEAAHIRMHIDRLMAESRAPVSQASTQG
jgi:RNA polymerase, sigma subunit, ECF family